jgi:hypothetical protein
LGDGVGEGSNMPSIDDVKGWQGAVKTAMHYGDNGVALRIERGNREKRRLEHAETV